MADRSLEDALGVDPDDEMLGLADDLLRADLQWLRALVERRKASMSQEDMAVRLGVTQPTVQAFESGRDPKLSTIRRYSLALGLSVEHAVEPRWDLPPF